MDFFALLFGNFCINLWVNYNKQTYLFYEQVIIHNRCRRRLSVDGYGCQRPESFA